MNAANIIKGFLAEAAVEGYRCVKFGTADAQVVKGAAVGDALVGVSTQVDYAQGEIADVVLAGVAEIKLGGTVTRGAPLTSDASGQGVAAAPAAGVNNRIVGFALASGVSGDIIPILVNPGQVQG